MRLPSPYDIRKSLDARMPKTLTKKQLEFLTVRFERFVREGFIFDIIQYEDIPDTNGYEPQFVIEFFIKLLNQSGWKGEKSSEFENAITYKVGNNKNVGV